MKLHIYGSGEDAEDDILVHYTLIAETETHRSTLEFYEYAETFTEFCDKLRRFPFENREAVTYKLGYWKNSPYELSLQLSLVDGAGRIIFRVETNDIVNNQISKFEDYVETQSLQELASKISNTNFSVKTELNWIS
jgi:hypothetical protein